MNITAVAIVAIICWAIVELVNSKRKKAPKLNETEINSLKEEITRLRERVQNLEKIVTDENYDLKKQFDNLKD
ncbi:hypothetical protein [Bowmanella dokdonensis]|uniref:Phage shock protein B n=1 Tax=Bowmanella dokdonensis TaxID=751969 RepID=A0A939DP65_9ALTE|nr:hypothetical protein [Bowmanella dokdonensis]MBN7826398.1 hypothetical protein [Bowmanella dokdonensis]